MILSTAVLLLFRSTTTDMSGHQNSRRNNIKGDLRSASHDVLCVSIEIERREKGRLQVKLDERLWSGRIFVRRRKKDNPHISWQSALRDFHRRHHRNRAFWSSSSNYP